MVVIYLPSCFQVGNESNFHIYLLMGQSNMAGRGVIGSAIQENARIQVYAGSGIFRTFKEPIRHLGDAEGKAGVGPAASFAQSMLASEKENVVIGLVPLAVGGSELSRWLPSGDLYPIALAHAKEAQKKGILMGILWHQGESDSGAPNLAGSYAQRFAPMVNKFRAELGNPNIPIVVGTLGEFIDRYQEGEGLCCWCQVNRQISTLPKYVKNLGVVRTTNLSGTGLHFDADSQTELGKRYASSMRKLMEKTGK